MTDHDGPDCRSCPSRRVLLAGAGAGLAATLAGCATYGSPAGPAPAAPVPATPAGGGQAGADAGGDSPPNGDTPPAGGASPTGGAVLARVADIPVGGGRVFAERQLVVTQPEAGTVRAFSAVCTHQGCTVAEVKGGTINCPCHGSRFRVADGSVAGGPASRPLAAVRVSVDGGTIRLA